MNADRGRREREMKYISLGVCLEPLLFPQKSNGVTSDVPYYVTKTQRFKHL